MMLGQEQINVRRIRQKLRMTQAEFATKFHLSVYTVRDWEHERYQPTGPARVLLLVIDRQPQAVLDAISPTATAA